MVVPLSIHLSLFINNSPVFFVSFSSVFQTHSLSHFSSLFFVLQPISPLLLIFNLFPYFCHFLIIFEYFIPRLISLVIFQTHNTFSTKFNTSLEFVTFSSLLYVLLHNSFSCLFSILHPFEPLFSISN